MERMVTDPKPDRTYLVYIGALLLLVLVTVINLFVVVPNVPLAIVELDQNAATRFLTEATSPYTGLKLDSPTVAADLLPGELIGVYHKPFYRSIFDLPLAAIGDVRIAGAFRLTLLEISLATILWIAGRLLLRKSAGPLWLIALLPILALPGIWSSFRLGDGVLIVLGLIMLGIWVLDQGHEELAGLLFALGFTSIEVLGLAYISLFLWLAYTRRVRVLAGFGLTMALLLTAAHLFDPNWYIGYLKSQYLFYQQDLYLTTEKTFVAASAGVGSTMAKITAVLFLAALFYEWHTIGKRDTRSFLWVLCLSLAFSPLIGIGTTTQGSVVQVLAIVLVIIRFGERWRRYGTWFSVLVMLLLDVLVWMQLGRSSVGFALFWSNVGLAILLYWVRWDSVRTTRLWADILEDQGKI